MAERLRLLWEDAGADVTFVGFRGGHAIPPEVQDAAAEFLGQVLGKGG